MIDNCTESSRMMFALGAAFCLFGLRFMLLRWREFAITEQRMRRARDEVEDAFRVGVNVLRRDDFREAAEDLVERREVRIVQATSDHPNPLL